MNKDIMEKMGFGKEVARAEQGNCAACGKPVKGFRDQASRLEHRISGLCQKCQDDTFGR
jgi:hypothetical protein